MGAEAGYRLVVDKERLRAEFHSVRGVLERYRRFLADSGAGEPRDEAALEHLRGERLGLLQARVSVGSVELAAALLRHVLGRLSLQQFRFRASAAQPAAAREAGPDIAAGAAADRDRGLGPLLSGLYAAAQSAPLEQQERLQRLLSAILDFFTALAEESSERVEASVARINLITANAESRTLLREIAVITRDVYRTMESVSDALPLDALSESSGGIPEAVQRLNSVMVRLEEAATQNLDHLEQAFRMGQQEAEALSGVIETLRGAQKHLMQVKEAHPELEPALTAIQGRLSDEVGAPAMTLQHQFAGAGDHHMEMIANQSFQELSSRTLKKILEFVQSLESELHGVLRQYQPGVSGEAPAREPRTPEDAPAGPSQSQDDVDKLLGELGF